MSKTLTIQYFAILREQRGVNEETLTTDAPDAATLYGKLAQEHGFTLPTRNLRAAINGAFVDWPGPLNDGDTVVFFPPVAGG
jgi:molybdopterin converting factor small subunit